MAKVRALLIITALTLAFAYAGTASVAFAYNQTDLVIVPSDGYGDCGYCHQTGFADPNGVHGDYYSYTRKCETCHTVHDAPTSFKLLRGETIKAACEACHDGSGGRGVYGMIAARGLAVGGSHSIEVTSAVPGGSATDGGTAAMTFEGPNGTLTCSDCHSPHDTDCVTPFLGERQREPALGLQNVPVSDRLLKRRPGGVAVPVAEYGSDWCLACHKGRVSGSAVHNHPVESSATVAAPYNYRRLGIIGPGPYPTGTTVLGPAGINTKFTDYNRAYLMPYPRTGAQAGHLPICQQCHEDTRDVGSLTADGTQANPSASNVVAGDGRSASANPRFMNFPHETTGYRLLVEAGTTSVTDDLCMNCHPVTGLP